VTGGTGPTTGATAVATTGASGSGTGGPTTSGTGGGTATAAATGGGTIGGTGGALNQPCSVDNNMDTCVAAGLVCEYSTDPAHTGTICELPAEFQPCQVAVGCDNSSLQCLSFSTGSYCFIPCESTSDCTTLYTTCQAPSSACIPGGVSGASHCAPLCGIDGGPSCPAPTFCQPSQAGDWGYCL